MRRLLVVVDMQNDFIDGSLGTKEAEAIVDNVVKVIGTYDPKDIFATRDTHPENYLETQDYQKLLERQVKQAVEFAGNDQMIIYLDPVDEDKLNRLALHNGNAELRISEYSFTGGTRAVIPARHILIDNSFQTKLEEAREKFHFDLSLTEGGRDHV